MVKEAKMYNEDKESLRQMTYGFIDLSRTTSLVTMVWILAALIFNITSTLYAMVIIIAFVNYKLWKLKRDMKRKEESDKQDKGE